jgi:uncharacterized cupredoxin-like copper-binding protein
MSAQTKTTRSTLLRLGALLIVTALGAATAHAHGPAGHGARGADAPREQQAWGIAGEPRRVTRTVEVRMTDDMRFSPASLEFKRGETVRFVVHNDGKQMHEFVIGTVEENAKHAEMMLKFPNMEHDEPWMAHVDPGEKTEIVWHFNRDGRFEFACLIAGHFQAGMKGPLTVTR